MRPGRSCRAPAAEVAGGRETAARERWGNLSGIEFRTAEATAFLSGTDETFDVVLSVFGAVWFIDPDTLLPLIRSCMAPGGVLAFSHLPPGSQGPTPVGAGTRHDRTPDEWGRILTGHGFSDVCVSGRPAGGQGCGHDACPSLGGLTARLCAWLSSPRPAGGPGEP